MDQVPQRLARWWRGLDVHQRRSVSALTLISALYVGHYLVFCLPQPFYIEDSGISFSYARNLVEGDGLVPIPGGERVEGYSNALWTFLIAGFYALGVPVWSSSKIMGAVFGVITLPLAYAITARALPPRPDGSPPRRDVALLAPLLLAVNPQFVIWNASGLENSLFCVLLAAGIYRVLVEDDRAGTPFPWSAVWFVLLSMTRPEGVTYAAIAAGAVLVGGLLRRKILPFALWLVVFLVPFAAYNYWRYEYFAWPFPNTYYAKDAGDKAFQPFGWAVRGWKYIKNYLWTSWTVFSLPLVVFGLTGLGGWRKGRGYGRGLLAVLTIAILALMIAWDGRFGATGVRSWWRPVVDHWNDARIYAILAAAVLFGVVTLTRPGWRARGLLWGSCTASVFFALYAGGDWMKGFRWFNQTSVTLMPLIAVGVGEFIDDLRFLERRLPLPRRWRDRAWSELWTGRSIALAVPFLALGGNGAWQSNQFALDPETAVRDVKRRVDYMTWVQHRLDLDHVTLVDVDMGAHMYFSGWDMVDIAGLVDVPIAHHRDYDKKFMREYLFDERDPEFAHVHAGWARTSKIPQHEEWKQRYLEIPGYPTGATALHVGNHVRRDLFIDSYDAPQPALTRFASGVDLVAFSVPSPMVASGGQLFIENAWQSQQRKDGFRILAVLEGTVDGKLHRAVSVLPPGYDWYKPEEWKRGEIVHGHQRMDIPEDLPAGTYTLSLVLIDDKTGQVLRQLAPGEVDPIPPEIEEEKPLKKPKPGKKATDADAKPAADEGDAKSGDDAPQADPPAAPPAEAPAAPIADAPPVETGPQATPYLPGGWRAPVEVRIVSVADATTQAEKVLDEAMKLAGEGHCDEAWPRWKDATRHVMRNTAWQERNEPMIRTEISACYLARADASSDEDERYASLVAGRGYDFRYAPLLARAQALAATYEARGDDLAGSEDWEGAFHAYLQALHLDPQRSWARRKAEDARDRRLKIEDYATKPPPKPAKTGAALDAPDKKAAKPPVKPAAKNPAKSPAKPEDGATPAKTPASKGVKRPGVSRPPPGGGPIGGGP